MSDDQPVRPLPQHPSPDQQRRRAKELLRDVRAGDPDALARVRRHLPDRAAPTLADAQFVLAREHGFRNWAAFLAHVRRAARPVVPTPEAREAVHRAFAGRDRASIRDALRRYPEARVFLDAPLFPFDAPALVHFATDAEMVALLLEAGADPNRRSAWWAGGFHPLHQATGEAAERLLAAGAVPDACAAANLDRPDLLRQLLDADPSRVHERGGDGQTPLHFARSRAVVDLLLARGADPDARDVDHRATPAEWMLERARGAGRYDLAAYLVERGASADVFLAAALGLADRLRAMLAADPSLLSLRTSRGAYGERPPSSVHIYEWTIGPDLSPLAVAARFGQDEAWAVMAAFAPPRERFLAACVGGRAEEARAVLAGHPDLVASLSPEEHRALAHAAEVPDPAAVALMMELGFDPAARGTNGGTALHVASWQGSPGAVAAILAHPRGRALLETRDPSWGATPLGWCLHGASNNGRPSNEAAAVAPLLLAAGAVLEPGWEGSPPAVREAIRAFLAR